MKYVAHDDDLNVKPPQARTRSDQNFSFPLNYSSYVWNTSQVPKPAPPAPVCNCMRGSSRTMNDVVTPGFKGLSKKGQIVNSPMLKTSLSLRVDGEDGVGFRSVDTNPEPDVTTTHEITGLLLPLEVMSETSLAVAIHTSVGSLITSAERSSAIGLASTAARAKIEQPSFTGLVSIGELRETLSYLRNPFKTGLKLASLLERDLKMAGTSKRGGSTASAIASVYLEFRYAVRPMIFEVQKALDTIASINLGLNPIRKTARAKQVVTKNVIKTNFGYDGGGFTYDVIYDIEQELSVRTGFLYEIVDGITSDAWWGMRPSDIPAALWELTPLSFVYDWAGNVGDFISAMTPVAGTRSLASWTTISERKTLTLTGLNYKSVYPNVQTVRSGNNRATLEWVQKTRHPSVNAPSLELRSLDKLANDPLRLLDLIGIFKQKMDPLAKKHTAFLAAQERASAFSRKISRF